MQPADIEKLISVGRPALAPDGSFAIFATSRPDLVADRAVGQLWRIDLPAGTPRRLTRGTADRSPAFAPDGRTLAFLRDDVKGRAQVFVVSASGGEPVQTTDAPLGVSEFAWSPEGTALAFIARVPEPGRYGTLEGREPGAEPARRITGIRWHSNGLGYTGDRPAQVFIVDSPSVELEPFYEPAPSVRHLDAPADTRRIVPMDARRLTADDDSYSALAFASEDELLVVVDHDEPLRRDLRTPLVALRTDGAGVREILPTSHGLAIDSVAVSADGSVAVLAYETGEGGLDFVAPGVSLWLVQKDGIRRLTDPETIDLGEVGSHITPLGEDFLVQDRARGRVRLLRVSREAEIEVLLDGEVEVTGHAGTETRVVAAISEPESFGELIVLEGGERRTLTSFGAASVASGVVTPRELTVISRDDYPVHGWIAAPDGIGPFPTILQIHGGPYASYGVHLFDETQILVEAGYAVVYCNPRGSAGYGRAHGRSIRHAMGTVDFTDVIDFLEGTLAADPRLDGARLGIMGGSYGGYLTAWAIAHDHRFAAAIVERGFLDPASFQGTSDIDSFFGDEYVGVSRGDIERQSPLAAVASVSTPTLVLHSELDFRCPLEQATRYYSALKRQGTEAEMLIFPGENHDLTRGGRPRHRVERFEAVLDWWRRYLSID